MLFIFYPGVGFAIIGGSVWLAYLWGDPEAVQRGGTVLTAFSALFLIYEAFFERAVRSRVDEERPEPKSSLVKVSPLAQVTLRIERSRWMAKRQKTEDEKLRLVILNSFMIILGELIQGFGDLGFKMVFGA